MKEAGGSETDYFLGHCSPLRPGLRKPTCSSSVVPGAERRENQQRDSLQAAASLQQRWVRLFYDTEQMKRLQVQH